METYTLCYNTLQVFGSKEIALEFYKECYYCSEGSEHERYANIIMDLLHQNILEETNFDEELIEYSSSW